jgi:pimeloyl-ACP methyl ester carboxylesterase
LGRVLRYDRSGSGRSPAGAASDRVAELHQLAVDAFGEQPVLLVGSSFGGQLALDYALAHPALVEGLLLIAPGLTGVEPSPELRERMRRLIAAARQSAGALADAWLSDPHHAPGGLTHRVAELVRTMLADNRHLFLSGSETAPARPAVGPPRELTHAGIVVIADRDDAHHRALAARVAGEAPRLNFRRVAGAGHYPSSHRVSIDIGDGLERVDELDEGEEHARGGGAEAGGAEEAGGGDGHGSGPYGAMW